VARVSKKFPERILVDFGNADEEGFPKISEAIAFKMPCDEIEEALSNDEACKYVREDIVDQLQAERDRYKLALEKILEYSDEQDTREMAWKALRGDGE
jgi:hypothetical protein